MQDPLARGVDRGVHARAGLQLMITSVLIAIIVLALMAFLLALDVPGKKYVQYGLLIIMSLAGFVFYRGRMLYGNLGFATTQPRVNGTVLKRRIVGIQDTYSGRPEVTYWLEIKPGKGKAVWIRVEKPDFEASPPTSQYTSKVRW